MSFPSRLTLALLAIALSTQIFADNHQHEHGQGHGMSHGSASTKGQPQVVSPTEGGQSAFSAIAEIVSLLDGNPNTDWAKVDIPSLRQHLVDMDRLTLDAEVDSQLIDEREIEFTVSGSGQTLRAIREMVPAHAGAVQNVYDWNISVKEHEEGNVLNIRVNEPQDVIRLQALGFFGFMAIGSHHQEHHLRMAMGQSH